LLPKSLLRKRKFRYVHPAITPQRMNFKFHDVPRHWFGGDPVMSHVLNSLSLTFPDGERFFVDAVRAFRNQVSDQEQLKEISGFIGQEAMHSLEHNAFNEYLADQGYDKEAKEGQEFARNKLNLGKKYLSSKQQLAVTAGLEHLTAIMGNMILQRPEIIEKIDPSVRDLWVWHAIEETEHKAVAYDLYQQVCGDYRLRISLFLTASSAILGYTTRYTFVFLKKDGLNHNPLVVGRGLWRLFGYKGLVTSMIPDCLRYLNPNFHPWQNDNRYLVEKWRKTLYAAEAA
jgi:predicted metal-dependent hydrolase